MKIKGYYDFINEWKMSSHWHNERASLKNKHSRIHHKDNLYPDGWTCTKLKKIGENSTIDVDTFLNKIDISYTEFIDKIEKSLHMLLTSKRIKNKNFLDTAHDHCFICIGKFAFKLNDDFYSPVFDTLYGSGNVIWADVKHNTGITFFYFPDTFSSTELQRKAFLNKLPELKNVPNEEYIKHFKLEKLYSDEFPFVILTKGDWIDSITKQIEIGIPYKEKNAEEINTSWNEWNKYLIPDATVILDKGTSVIINDKIKTIIEVKIDQSKNMQILFNDKTVKNIKFDTSIDIVAKDSRDTKIRETGKLPNIGVLVKSVHIKGYRKSTDNRNNIFGSITDYYIFKNGEKIHTILEK